MPEPAALRAHEDVALFREAIRFTAAQTTFAARLIEKDYFGSLVLQYLAANVPCLIFRGGTCLAKVYFGFYRLSEDLDFLVSTPVDASRAERSRRAEKLRQSVAILGKTLPFEVATPLRGVNESRQYDAAIAYRSLIAERQEILKIEVAFREPVITAVVRGSAQTMLLDPITRAAMVPGLAIPSLARDEAMAEKLRAALSRRDVAIRDFYDVDHALRNQVLRRDDAATLRLVRRKLDIPGNEPVDVSEAKRAVLQRQVDTELRPVLREDDFASFDLNRAFDAVRAIAGALRDPGKDAPEATVS